ncbi:RagB/SusD family nutrient uptake outer membrane protein [Olivibacter sp. CPCC 100613]|uniref:RagB/SusD family nutrient uptake outer membrane protein n=1 Tax=Olivibacter sp. CPCC 100613 TaxID=3079931 RepID=UPI002FF9983A
MKKYLILSILFVFIISSCSKDYLDTKPTDKVDGESVFNTVENASKLLNGIYRLMFQRTEEVTSNQQNKPGVGGILLNVEFMGEDLGISNNNWFSSEASWNAHRVDNNIVPQYVYRTFYRMIGNANNIIDNVDAAIGAESEKVRVKAEAITLRAYAYTYLVQFFAKRYDATAKPNTQPGIPLPLSSGDSDMPRASVEEVYAAIIKDLEDVIALNVMVRENKSHINALVAKALRARVALTMQDYPNAIKYSKEVIDGGEFPLMSEAAYLSGFNNAPNLSEVMWASMPTEDQGDTFGSFFAQIAYDANTSFMRANPKRINSALYDQISESDIRKKLWEPVPTSENFPLPSTAFARQAYMSRKFAVKVVGGPSLGDVPLVRSAEMYLILAEAYAKNGQEEEAQNTLFQLNSVRDSNAKKSIKTGPALIEEILFNRRIELWGEGFRWLDLKRLNLPLNRTLVPNFVSASVAGVMEIPAGDIRWQFLIPRLEMEANPNIGEQNP